MSYQSYDRNLFAPLAEGRDFLITISKMFSGPSFYGSDTTSNENTILIANRAKVIIPEQTAIVREDVLKKELEHFGLTEIGRGPKNFEKKVALICKLVQFQPLKTLYGGLFMNAEDPYNINPIHQVSELLKQDPPFLDEQFGNTIELEFYGHKQFKQVGDSRVVIPGMKLPEFLKIRINLKSKSLVRIPITWFRISIVERARGHHLKQSVSVRYHSILEKKSLGDLRPGTLGEVKQNWASNWCVELAEHNYLCQIPKFGPTFYSDEISRSYALSIEAEMYLKKGPGPKFTTEMGIEIASEMESISSMKSLDPEDHLAPVDPDEPPPEYTREPVASS